MFTKYGLGGITMVFTPWHPLAPTVTVYEPGCVMVMLCVVCPVLHNHGPGPLEVSVMPVAKQVPVCDMVTAGGNETVTFKFALPLQLVTVMVPALATERLPCHNI